MAIESLDFLTYPHCSSYALVEPWSSRARTSTSLALLTLPLEITLVRHARTPTRRDPY